MRLYLAFVTNLYAAFNPAIHTDMNDDGLLFEFYHAEGEVAEVRIERPQQGWAFLTPGAPIYAIISESITGDPADAMPIARGRIVGMPDGMFEKTQTITVSCAPLNFLAVDDRYRIADGPLMAYARANLGTMPETCPYLSDFDRNDPVSYLLGRSEFYYCHPVTHEVSTSHIAIGDRIVNLSDSHFHDDKSVPSTSWGEPPVPRARLKLVAAWLQQGTRLCNIASMHLRGSGVGGVLQVDDRAVVTLPSGLSIAAGEYAMVVHALYPAGVGASITLEMRHRLPDGTDSLLATLTLADDQRATISEQMTDEYPFGEADAVYVIVTDIVGASGARDVAVTLNTVDIG